MPRPPLVRTTPLSTNRRRTILKAGGTLLLSVLAPLRANAAQILAVRVWPAADYTRVTLENDGDIKATHFMVTDPPRLVVEIAGLELNNTLKSLVAKIESNDPYIKRVRVAQNRPSVVRLVFELKETVKPQVFNLTPVAGYKHRLIFDLYPVRAADPLATLIQERDWTTGDGPPPPAPIDSGAPAAAGKLEAQAAQATGTPTPQQAARPTPAPTAAPNGAKVTRMITIALDPGHGGEDPGATGASGVHEKDIVLSVARRLKARLEGQPNVRVILTRDADYFVPLGTRVDKARKVQADLFVSIHADAFVERSARGSSVFVLSEKGASSSAARWLANDQNNADLIGGVNLATHDRELASVLFDLSTTAQITDSLKLGKAVLTEIGGINRLHRGAVEQAGFAVLKAPDIPSILVETAFISNPEEEARLKDDGYQDQLADAITKGIRRYFAANPPMAKSRIA
jgi:N-acetylmuramoyl-L-alanine amidase